MAMWTRRSFLFGHDRARGPRVARALGSCLARQGTLCEICRDACEPRAIGFVRSAGSVPVVDPQLCNGCGACVPACPVAAISLGGPA